MAAKKKAVEEKPGPWALGRFSTALKIGIVGMPNVGKSTLYNALTKCAIPAENFPFCTIDPNTTRVNVPDERFDWLVAQNNPKSVVQAYMEVVDIAGLVKGAADGEGLGNAFLSHIKSVDGIVHVMRAFDDPEVVHVESRVDPVGDIEIITEELRIKDLEFMENKLAAMNKDRTRANSTPLGKKEWEAEVSTIEKIIAWLKEGKEVRNGMDIWSAKDIDKLNEYMLLTAKPVMYLINLSEADYKRKKNKYLARINEWVQAHGGGPMIPFSGALEQKLQELGEEEAAAYCEREAVISALPKIIKSGYALVHLICFFTAGPDEVRAWTIRKGYKAPQAAGTIHTDFEQGFICAEVMAFDVLKELGTEAEVKKAGKYRQEGKGYTMIDGDVVFFKFNVTTKSKK